MVTNSMAFEIAENYIDEVQSSYNLAVFKMIEFSNGFLVVIQTKEFIETGNLSESLIGRPPIIVDKHDGSVYLNAQLLSDEQLIQAFNEERGYRT